MVKPCPPRLWRWRKWAAAAATSSPKFGSLAAAASAVAAEAGVRDTTLTNIIASATLKPTISKTGKSVGTPRETSCASCFSATRSLSSNSLDSCEQRQQHHQQQGEYQRGASAIGSEERERKLSQALSQFRYMWNEGVRRGQGTAALLSGVPSDKFAEMPAVHVAAVKTTCSPSSSPSMSPSSSPPSLSEGEVVDPALASPPQSLSPLYGLSSVEMAAWNRRKRINSRKMKMTGTRSASPPPEVKELPRAVADELATNSSTTQPRWVMQAEKSPSAPTSNGWSPSSHSHLHHQHATTNVASRKTSAATPIAPIPVVAVPKVHFSRLDPYTAAVAECASQGVVSISGRRVVGDEPSRFPTSQSPSYFVTDMGRKSRGSSDAAPAGGEASNVSPVYGVVSIVNRRKENEDAVSAIPSLGKNKHFFGIFDGHGGHQASQMCGVRMHHVLREELALDAQSGKETGSRRSMEYSYGAKIASLRGCLERSFARMDLEVGRGVDGASPVRVPESAGTTACVAVVEKDVITVANCGDSRAVLCRSDRSIPLSRDHKAERPDEVKRIEAAGGRVVFWNGFRVLGILAMSRAIGDRYLKPYVIAEPETLRYERTGEDECLIIASDGLWDAVSNDEACKVAKDCLHARSDLRADGTAATIAAACLAKLASSRGSTDNISVVVVDLKASSSA